MSELIELTVDKIVAGGSGIGHAGDMVVFVPLSAPGDRLRVRVVNRKRNYWQGIVEDIIEPSPLRTQPVCPYYGTCGGCDLQHLSYESQLVVKKLILNDALQRIGKVFVPPDGPLRGESAWEYRNKSQYPVTGPPWRVGFFQRRSHRVVDTGRCMVQSPVMDRIRATVKKRLESSAERAYDEELRSGNLRHVVVKHSRAIGQAALVFVTATNELAAAVHSGLADELPELVSVVQNVNPEETNRVIGSGWHALAGTACYHDRVLGATLRVSAGSFFQANTPVADLMVKRVLKCLEPDGSETVVDLFCGVGTITLPIAGFVKRVIGIESGASAVEDARFNLESNTIGNVEIVQATSEEGIAKLEAADAIVLDPPRKGCTPALLNGIARVAPRKVIYVSCNPPTLARDLAQLQTLGFAVSEITPLDMFPQTSHVETVVKLVRRDGEEA
jgi:23S rRNA (uracil1939-C5)-methyltransferase